MDYRKLSALLCAWDDASLSAGEERELESCVSDSDYEILAAEADAFISCLAAGEKKTKRRPAVWLWLSAAAACAVVITVAAWLFMPDYGTEKATRMATVETVKPAESVKTQDDYKGSAPAAVQPSVVPRKPTHTGRHALPLNSRKIPHLQIRKMPGPPSLQCARRWQTWSVPAMKRISRMKSRLWCRRRYWMTGRKCPSTYMAV